MPSNSIITILLVAACLRVVPILILDQYESVEKGQLLITDIDYKVYSDAVFYANPYSRHTYRYSPLISYLMAYNYTISQTIGKIAFALFDLIAVWYLWKILTKKLTLRGPSSDKDITTITKNAKFITKLYAYNPLMIYLTVRGSCESLSMALMFAFWFYWFGTSVSGNFTPKTIHSLKKDTLQPSLPSKILSYVIYGIWVHVRLYPILFLPLLLIYEYKNCLNQNWGRLLRSFVVFGVVAGGVFLGLFAIFYAMYGEDYANESLLYHLTRKDNRHSFSPFFYDIYLSYAESKMTRVLPMALLTFVLTTTFSSKLSLFFLQFLITFGFVEFNRVVTMQYYMWVWGSLLLVLPESRIVSFRLHQKGFNLAIQWLFGVGLWVWMSIKLEREGQNIVTGIWVICVVKMALDTWVLLGFIRTVKEPTDEELNRIKLDAAKSLLLGSKSSSKIGGKIKNS